MNVNKPVLVGWQASGTAAFIRRHAWFFRSSTGASSFYMILCVYAPAAFLALAVVLIDMLGSFILVEAALEGTR